MENQKNFKPYIPAEKTMPELTPTAIIIGTILAVVFGGANAYLGLRVGMTVSASIPAAVIPFKTVVVDGAETTQSLAQFVGGVLPFRFEGMAGNFAGLAFFALIILSILKFMVWHKDNKEA